MTAETSSEPMIRIVAIAFVSLDIENLGCNRGNGAGFQKIGQKIKSRMPAESVYLESGILSKVGGRGFAAFSGCRPMR